jgi:hypothetical protein
MSEIEKITIFNPKDKTNEKSTLLQSNVSEKSNNYLVDVYQKNKSIEKPKIYLDCVPQKFKSLVKQNKCKYDLENHKWYTLDEKSKMIHDFSKKRIDFWDYMNEMGIQYDKENKIWYTYNSNESLQKFFIE